MAQWASAYAEAALGLSKTLGDLAGPCMFAVTMGISRVIFGKYGDKPYIPELQKRRDDNNFFAEEIIFYITFNFYLRSLVKMIKVLL